MKFKIPSFAALFWSFATPLAFAEISKNDMTVGGGTSSASANEDVTFKDDILPRVQDIGFALVSIVAVGVFIWIAFQLFSARGNEEEFKKAWLSLVYAVIGFALIPSAYAIVKIVTGFTL